LGRTDPVPPVRPELVLTEKEWQRQVLDLARLCGWRHGYHTFDSRRSASGFPDLVLVRERVIFAELKSETGKLSAAQADWLAALEAAGAETYVWRPSDVVDVMQALRRRAH
jgi:hypothetical protein